MVNDIKDIFIAVVKNHEGLYFKSFSYYSGNSWTNDIRKAKIYTKLGVARTRVTLIVQYNKQKKITMPIPVISELIVSGFIDIDQTERVTKAFEKQVLAEKQREVKNAIWRKEQVQRDYDKAKRELDELGRKLQKQQN
jgi:hypothetical protein